MGLERLVDFGLRADVHNPPLVGKFAGPLLLIGTARCVWDDLEPYRNTTTPAMCINDIGMHYYGRLVHWYSNDHKMLQYWVPARRPRYKEADAQRGDRQYVHSCNEGGGGKYHWPWPGHGTSSLNACYTALALGYEQIILCGVPLSDGGHYFDPPWVKTNFENEVKKDPVYGESRFWLNARDLIFDGKVKSMSGRTQEMLGAP